MSNNLIIDTNLLLLLIIGSVDNGTCISKSKRLTDYSLEDYDFLVEVMGRYKNTFITPYIATEVSNLIDLKDQQGIKAFKNANLFFQIFEQIDVNIKDDCNLVNFEKFGITDASLVKLVKDYSVLTNDGKLYPMLINANFDNTLFFPNLIRNF